LREISGAEVAILTFEGQDAARVAELNLSRAGVPFIAEIDEFHIPAAQRERAHVVHAVLVVERTADRVFIVDSTISSDVMEYSAAEYELMRSSTCLGRVEHHKLYAVTQIPTIKPDPCSIRQAVRRHLNETLSESLRVLDRYIQWAEGCNEPIDVCRAAGERFQATLLFGYLAEAGVKEATKPAALLDQLTKDWYLVHMLATHERSAQQRARRRIVRLLKQLAVNEINVAEVVLG
jgi:hypothetical protein